MCIAIDKTVVIGDPPKLEATVELQGKYTRGMTVVNWQVSDE